MALIGEMQYLTIGNSTYQIVGGGSSSSSSGAVSTSLTISISDWSNETCTKTVAGVTSDNIIIITPNGGYWREYTKSRVYCSAQGTNSLTFNCEVTPTTDLVLNILIIDNIVNGNNLSY